MFLYQWSDRVATVIYWNEEKQRLQSLSTHPFLISPFRDGAIEGWKMVRKIHSLPSRAAPTDGPGVRLPAVMGAQSSVFPVSPPAAAVIPVQQVPNQEVDVEAGGGVGLREEVQQGGVWGAEGTGGADDAGPGGGESNTQDGS
uniref:Uncharacterized protein n=1 Tax=Chromera velia CCMP2878 TaxID=1169474 RepID=A0A0G4IBR6_9ALVE|eukprot:Cvel_12869.t1-p1 / transcript=Cvel_12869.t1 / gene=Cvel_12869 / organism=Chromera_velia_CCMP2878 / gene_product=hypothetical protein / transcript_product=hypothetical protein / location=Cvel_scaffold859:13159-13584(-) / protein_length=142 / sequence_SO=supercontig / SO=protein_coding / is_pseudo=false